MRTSGQKPHLVQEDAAQAHGLSPGPRAARRGRRVWNRRHERSYETDSAVPPPRWNSRRHVARRAPSRRIDIVVMSGHPTRTSRAQIRRAVELCRPRRPPERRRGGRKRVAPRQRSRAHFLVAPSAGRGLSRTRSGHPGSRAPRTTRGFGRWPSQTCTRATTRGVTAPSAPRACSPDGRTRRACDASDAAFSATCTTAAMKSAHRGRTRCVQYEPSEKRARLGARRRGRRWSDGHPPGPPAR